MVMAMLTLVSGVVAVSADCGVAGVGYQSQKWEKFDGTTSACDCDSKCCKSGLAGVSGYTRSRGTCYCQMDANPSQHTDVGSVSGRCSGNMVSNSTLNMGASVSRMPLSIEHTKTAEKVDQSWTCWHFTPSDNALINSGTSMADVCLSHGSSFRFVKGGGLPGCGTCWCCHTSSTEAHESMPSSIENTKTTEVVVKQETPRKVKNEVGACFANRRVDCGFAGISSNQCTGYSCCYLKVSKGLSCTLPKECTDTGAMDSPKDCGWPGISMDQCNQRGCCYSHGAAAGGMSCWYAAGSEAMLNSTAAQSTVVNPASGKCLDIYHADYEDEAKVQIYTCNGGENQKWMLQNQALVNPASGMCLDIYNHDHLSPDQYKDETKVELYSCNGNPNQQWAFKDGQLVNTPSGKCLDIHSPQGELKDETPVQLFSCSAGKPNQAWTMDRSLLI